MSEWDIGSLIYLVLLGSALAFWFFLHNRDSISTKLQQAGIWVLIFMGVIAVVGLWDDIQRGARPSQTVFADQGQVEVPRSPDGHYYMTLQVNDVPVEFVVDTGATNVVLTQDDARRIGVDVDALNWVGRANTANGTVRTAPVWLDRVARDQAALVNGGQMERSLLGMTYLQKWSEIAIRDGRLVLTR